MAIKVPGNVLAEYPDLFALVLILLLTGEQTITLDTKCNDKYGIY